MPLTLVCKSGLECEKFYVSKSELLTPGVILQIQQIHLSSADEIIKNQISKNLASFCLMSVVLSQIRILLLEFSLPRGLK